MDRSGKKTAPAIHREIAREVNQLLGRIFAQRHKNGRTDLEAVEIALRAALHQAGATALSELLQYEAPTPDQHRLPCPCDGAEWIWNIADQHFPGAVQIVDLYHARQHLWDLAHKLFPNQEAEQRRWMIVHQDMLDEGNIEQLVAALRSIDSSSPELPERIRIEAGYFVNNAKRMRYPEFRRQHLFVGSGVIEAGCKNVISARCKQSGMRHARKRVLDRSWRQRHHRSSLLPTQR